MQGLPPRPPRLWLRYGGVALLTAGLTLAAIFTFSREARIRVQTAFTAQAKACRLLDPGSCPTELVCAHTNLGLSTDSSKQKAICQPRPQGRAPLIAFPFHPRSGAFCIQGPATEAARQEQTNEGHDRIHTLHALDLAPHEDHRIHAGMSGVVIAHGGCSETAGTAELRADCGNGFGNHVLLVDGERGLLLLYAHLAEITVKNGSTVQAGDLLGTVGRTGSARGLRHLHLSAHSLPKDLGWMETVHFLKTHPGSVPPSQPFETLVCDQSRRPECVRQRVRMDQLPCGAKNSLLKADWRDLASGR